MAYIPPNTTVELFGDVHLSDNYSDTGYFAYEATKDEYFDSLSPAHLIGRFESLTYQREKINYVRVNCPYAAAIHATYMRFRNTSFERKWFYAFVKSVEYINNDVVQINYVNDPVMTWMGTFGLSQCFVERNHSLSDGVGDNIIPELFYFKETDYVMNESIPLKPGGASDDTRVVIIAYAFSGLAEAQNSIRREGIFSGLGLKAFLAADLSGINSFIRQFAAQPDAIVSMYMCTQTALGLTVPVGGIDLPESINPVYNDFNVSYLDLSIDKLDGYTPRNKKLYTYPFNYCSVTNQQGDEITGRYEYGDNLSINGRIYYSCIQPVTQMLRFKNYKNSGNSVYPYETLTLTGYPVCSWTSDAFSAWIGQNVIPYGLSIMGQGMVAGATGGSSVALEGNVVGTVMNAIASGYSAAIAPDMLKGNVASGNLAFSSDTLNFFMARMSINNQIARQIDKFFDMYGYAYNQVQTPVMNARPHWTYLKTKGCIVTGDIPAEDCAFIEKVIDNGIRFWNSISEIGLYNELDNSLQ